MVKNCRCITQKVKTNFTFLKQGIVVLSFDRLYVHLEVSPTYSLAPVRFSVKMVKFPKINLEKIEGKMCKF